MNSFERFLEGHSHARVCRAGHGAFRKWTVRDEEPKYAPDRTCDIEHMRLELEIDLPKQMLEATCTHRLRAAYGPFSEITLDAVNLEIRSVQDSEGRSLAYSYLDKKLVVSFPRPVRDTIDLEIRYRVERPSHGLYFIGPWPGEEKAEWQVWSQGEDEEARHWIPCHDAPHERMTTEMIVTADAKYHAVSNGKLVSAKTRGRKTTWHYVESTAYPSYLVSLCVGVFARIEDRWRDVPVEYFVDPGREGEARRSFGKTPRMLEFFSRVLDCPYPYEKYSQVAVRHFIFGGMENLSATTQTDNTLHDQRAALDFTSDELVAHELAHQWFGDLLTCEHWAHAWLNEGFATYFDALWKEEDKGRDEFDYAMIQNAAEYMAEPYRRAIISRRFAHPFQLFDAHLYPKAAWVLHMLRRRLGDDLFWKAVRLYVKRHAGQSVETIDLVRACESASGKSLQSFFDQWLLYPGHPDLDGDMSWNGEAGCVTVNLRQVQPREGGAPTYKLPLVIEAAVPNAAAVGKGKARGAARSKGADFKIVRQTFQFDQPTQTFYVFLPAKPIWVTIDPDGAHLKSMKVERPLEWLEALLVGPARHERVFARVDGVRQAAHDAGHRAALLLARVLKEDPFWGVQVEAAGALGRIKSDEARDALIRAAKTKHPKARRAVASALGGFRHPEAVDALRKWVKAGDPSYFVQNASLVALGRSAGPSALPDLRRELKAALKRKDWHDVVAQGAAVGLAQTRDPEVMAELLSVAADPSRYWGTRLLVFYAMADLGAARPEVSARIAEELPRFLDDPEILVATRLPDAFTKLGNKDAIPALRAKASVTPDPHMREACLLAADALAAQARPGEDVATLRGEVDKLREEARGLRQRLDQMSATKDRNGKRRRN